MLFLLLPQLHETVSDRGQNLLVRKEMAEGQGSLLLLVFLFLSAAPNF